MKLSPEDYDRYYAALGIQRSDLLSTDAVSLAELPPDAKPSAEESRYILSVIEQWNRMDERTKVDAAQNMEMIVLEVRHPAALRSEAWAAYLMLGRVRGCEARREMLRRVALGEVVPTPSRRRRKSPLSGMLPSRAK
jgi:hypothetical protein